MDGDLTEVIRKERFGLVREASSLRAVGEGRLLREVEAAEHHVLGRRNDWRAVGWRQEVVRREHQLACLLLRRLGERHMDRHLVAVEVGVERRTNERMNADCRTLDEHRHERLDAESVQGWGAVEQHRVILDHVGEHLPHHVGGALGEALGALDVVRMAELNELTHDEWLEEFEGHLLWDAALVQLQLWAHHDDGAARIVDALAEKVLAESPLLPLEHVAERLESVIASAGDGATTSAVVDEGVDRLLEHALLVAHDDFRGAELDETLQPVVAVDHATIEVVQVGGGETATVELHHWAQVWWDHRKDRHDHPLWSCTGAAEGLEEAESLDCLLAAHAGGVAHLNGELLRFGVEVHALDEFADRLGTHAGAEDARAAWALAAELGVEGTEAVELVLTADFWKQLECLQAEERLLLLGDLFLAALR